MHLFTNIESPAKEKNNITAILLSCLLFFILSIFTFWGSVADTATPPSIITYQGKLLENGSSVGAATNMGFLLYDDPAGGNLLYTAAGTLLNTGTISVTPSSGIFSVSLGAAGTNAITSSIFADNAALYLEVWIDGEQMSPRKRLTSAAYAINSEYLMGMTAALSSSSQYVPYSDANGRFTFVGDPQSTAVGGGSIYINPASADANETLFAIALGGSERFRVDEDGDAWFAGGVTVTGTLTVDTDTLVVDSGTDRVGINSSTPNYTLAVEGSTFINGPLTTRGRGTTPVDLGVDLTLGAGDAYDLVVQGNYAYVAEGALGLSIVDITNPIDPVVVATFDPAYWVFDIFISGNYLYVTDTNGGLYILDVSDFDNIQQVGTVAVVVGSTTDVVVAGNYAYVDANDSGMKIVDVSHPTNPVVVGTYAHAGNGRDMAVAGRYVYYLNTGEGVAVVDVSDPTNPAQEAVLNFGDISDADKLFLNGNLLYITRSGIVNNMAVVDVSDPTAPVDLGDFAPVSQNTTIGRGFVSGRYLYIPIGLLTDSFKIIDLGDDPRVVASYQEIANLNVGGARNVWVSGNYAYLIGESPSRFDVIDVSGLRAETAFIGNIRTDHLDVNDFASFNNGLFIRNGAHIANNGLLLGGNLALYDTAGIPAATNTIAFSHTALFETNAPASDANAFIFNTKNTLTDGHLLSVRNNGTVRFVIDESGNVGINTTNPQYELTVTGDAWVSGELSVGGTLFSVNSTTNRVGVNTATPNSTFAVDGTTHITGTTTIRDVAKLDGKIFNPVERSLIDPSTGFTENVVVVGDTAYLQDSADGLIILDVHDPDYPVLIGSVDPGGTLEDVAVQGNYAYMVGSNGISIIGIEDPTAPVVQSTLALTGAEAAVTVSGNYAYAAVGGGLQVVDVSDPLDPTLVSFLEPGLATVYDVFVDGSYAYVAAGTGGLYVIDIRDPYNLVLTDSLDPGEARGVFVQGHFAYLGGNAGGMYIIDVRDPYNIVSESTFTPAVGNVTKIFVSGKHAYLANFSATLNQNGITIVDISSSTNPTAVIDNFDLSIGAQQGDIVVSGNYIYNALISDGLAIVDVSGTDISNARIGNARIANLDVNGITKFNHDVSIRGGLSVGNSGLLVNGTLSIMSPTTTASATNTIRFTHTTLFETSVPSGDSYAYIFNTKNALANGAGVYLLSVRNGGSPVFSIATNGDVHTTGTYYGAAAAVSTPGTPGDLAERVDVLPGDAVEPGDVMVVDSGATDRYAKSTSAYSSKVAGVISTNPTITIGSGKTEHTAVMAMVGRVPVKVSNQNGAIARGDLLVTASTTGYAMRYDPQTDAHDHTVAIIGVALEPLDGESGKIMALIRSGWVDNKYQTIAELQQQFNNLAAEEGEDIAQDPEELHVEVNNDGQLAFINEDLNLNGHFIIHVAGISGVGDRWQIDESGRFVTRVVTTEGDKSLYALQSQNTEYVLSGSSQLDAGEAIVTFDEVTKQIIDPTKGIKVSVTLTSNANGIFISEKTEDGFTVKELLDGKSNATFDWVVIAERRVAEDANVLPGAEEQANPEEPVNSEEPQPEENVGEPEVPAEEVVVEEVVEQPPQEDIPVEEPVVEPAPAEEVPQAEAPEPAQ